jgi:UDP-N-acetylmuramoyl-L-alanyl-D-glutamate--2,6-diaminopimelate ligase
MINSLLKEAKINKSVDLQGLTNVIQECGLNDILLMPCRSEDQLNSLLDGDLPKGFRGLLISPYIPKMDVNYLVKSRDEIKDLEKQLIDYFYPIKENQAPKIVGVTGTNGKTSVSWIVAELCRLNGKSALYAGTPGVFIDGRKMSEQVLTTTPSYMSLRKLLSKYGEDVDLVAIEVSSHALDQNRLSQLRLDVGAWTNFTQDHLDYHENMTNYFEAKKKIFEIVRNQKVYVPENSSELLGKLKNDGVIKAKTIESYKDLIIPEVFKSGFPKNNLELALALYCDTFGELDNKKLTELTLPPGRFQIINQFKKVFIVDYAHTPDALESVLKQIRESYPNKKVMTVFGCGGNRDSSKRPVMGKVAIEMSDKVVVTSDNPRNEKPMEIIKDITETLDPIKFEIEVDREKAIKLANTLTSSDWVILIAGKGHEAYQEIEGKRYDFDDVEVIKGLS